MAESSTKWYVARTGYGMERKILREVQKMGYESYAPFGATRTGMSIPVFPCYAFVRFDIECDGWQNINDIRGFTKFLPLHTSYPTPVADKFIDYCKAKEQSGAFDVDQPKRLVLKYRPGDAVHIRSGSMEGKTGKFIEQRNNSVVLTVPMFNSSTKVVLPVTQVADVVA